MLKGQVGKEAQRFFPYVFSIFIFILGSNMLGMTMFSFTLTSHIMVTFTLGVSTFIGLTILGFVIQHLHFLNLFLPKGIPSALIPMLVVIEIISYFSSVLMSYFHIFISSIGCGSIPWDLQMSSTSFAVSILFTFMPPEINQRTFADAFVVYQ